MRTTWLILAALALSPALAHADKRLDGGQVHQGFALEPHVSASLLSFSTGGGGTTGILTSFHGGFFAGYKISRFIAGLGFDLLRTAQGMSIGNTSTDSARTAFVFSPGLRVAIVRSADNRVELFGQLDLGFGTTVNDPSTPNTSNFHFAYDVGPGVRYWVHPQFAFSGVALLDGQFEFNSTNTAGTTTKTSTGLTSITAALQLLGVF
jgi:Outer membrane protein beta-barrel domain